MSLLNKSKQAIIAEFQVTKNDTGSAEVQCAILTSQINNLTEHMKVHRKDFSSKRGLLTLVGKRRRMLDHLKKEDSKRYDTLIKKLDIRK
jgi:small subunit ribosomal protein S15